ncbi:hypothetical protein ACDZ28_13655 [Paenibacillus sp. RS8]|uniref:hypothetical protein n=1 Tax=Paenibacillus sp. RS8 TaxID=3242681 RepID=UPI0035C23B21
MALALEKLTLDSGIDVESSYVRIDTINGNKNSLTIGVSYYVSQESFSEGKPFFEMEWHTFQPSVADGSLNYHKQGYEYLKTLPKFENAIDVLE